MRGMRRIECLGHSAAGFHRLSRVEWGDADNPRVLFCVHGLTRNARDFDVLAEHLSHRYRVVCPDVVGRGRSGWLADGAAYHYAQYLADMTVVLAHTGARRIDWVGTSMGGLIGMMMAAAAGSPVDRLVLNDVGPRLPLAALRRLGEYVGQDTVFPDLDAMVAHLRTVSAGFGPLTGAQWRHLAQHGACERDGGVAYRYDPAIGEVFSGLTGDVDLWPVWSTVDCPVLVLRGADSDLLDAATAGRMARRQAPTEVVEFAGIGHAPMLMSDDQVAVVARWLD